MPRRTRTPRRADFGGSSCVVCPDADGIRVGEGVDAEIGEGRDDDFFQAVHVGADGEFVIGEATRWDRRRFVQGRDR